MKRMLFVLTLISILGSTFSSDLLAMYERGDRHRRMPAAAAQASFESSGSGPAAPTQGRADAGRFSRVISSPWSPWNWGSVLVSKVKSYTGNAEPVRDVLVRFCVEAGMTYLLLFLLGDNMKVTAGMRLNLADFALEDLFSATPFHYTDSRSMIALKGLKHLMISLACYTLHYGGIIAGSVVGIRCVYDAFIKLPLSAFKSVFGVSAAPPVRQTSVGQRLGVPSMCFHQ